MITVKFAEGCAWRAIYVYAGACQIFHLGVDPDHGVTPVLFGAIANQRLRFRLPLPRIPWSWVAASGYNRVVSFVYRVFAHFWASVDGRRYGR